MPDLGKQIANSATDLLDGVLVSPVDRNEAGNTPGGASADVWTGSNFNGTLGTNCADWTIDGGETGTVGFYTAADPNWIDAGEAGCSGTFEAHLYCFEL